MMHTGQSIKNFDNNEPGEGENETDSIKVTREDLDLGHLEVGAQMEIVDIKTIILEKKVTSLAVKEKNFDPEFGN